MSLLVLGFSSFIIALIILGVTPFFTSPSAKTVICGTSGLALIYMGYRLIRDARGIRPFLTGWEARKGLHPVFTGIVGSVSNPYWIIWWVTIGLGYLVSSLKFGFFGVVVFFIGHIMADLAWYSLISLAVSKGKNHGRQGIQVFAVCLRHVSCLLRHMVSEGGLRRIEAFLYSDTIQRLLDERRALCQKCIFPQQGC